MNKNAVLCFHQGWTDIINCLALINYYCKLYSRIYLIIRDDSEELVNFYVKDIKNLEIYYFYKKYFNINRIIRALNNLEKHATKVKSFNNIYIKLDLQHIDFLGIGYFDNLRNDKYKNSFIKQEVFFVNRFYTSYNIPYITRINNFTFNRNKKLEENKYREFIIKYGQKYILYHETIEKYDKNITIVNLNGISNIFFDMIKVLENAIEIHLLDSVWGALIYQLDAKYKLFQSKKIILYAKRGYNAMFLSPVKLDNWIIK